MTRKSPRRMLLSDIAAIRENTDRILELVEAQPAASVERSVV
ncbi:MAG: hypothetical protein U0R50_14390 [Gaiellales bacterium]